MKKRLIGATLVAVAAALLISSIAGIWMFHRRELQAARDNLHELLILMDAQSAITDPAGVARQFLQAAPEKRLTIITPQGEVLADTETAPDGLENHADRPEIEAAAAYGWGEATRRSDTLNTTMLYVAKRFADGMVGRASMPLASIDSLVYNSLWAFALAAAAAILLTLPLARRTAGRVLEPLRVVSDTLQGVLDGARTPTLEAYQADDELRPILRNLDKLVERLGGYIEGITAERDKVNLILDCMDEGFLLLDETGDILASNQAARRLFGLTGGDGSGSIQVFIRSKRVRDALRETRRKRSGVVLDVDDPALSGRSLRMFFSPVAGRQYEGQQVGASILISDVTELKRAEGIRAQFTANVSHELKTPLTSIKGFTDMLCSDMVASPEDQKRFLTLIGVEVDRLIDLINDILKLSELESVAIEQSPPASDALAVAREVADLLAPTARSAEVTLTVSGEAARAAIPYGRLKELLLNLAENGVKYNVPGGQVSILVERLDALVRLTVTDTGIGIPPEAQERIFERFYRVDGGRDRKHGGTGLGLAIVKHIAARYGGRVTLESVPEQGSTFRVVLPPARPA